MIISFWLLMHVAATASVHGSEDVTQCIDKTLINNQTLLQRGVHPCTAERWCPAQWPNAEEKTAPKPRIHALKYYIYKTKTGRRRNIGLRFKWSNSAYHYEKYIDSYSMVIFTLGQDYEFRICFDTNKTKIVKYLGQNNQTMVKFSYDYECEVSCVPILPGKSYYVVIMTNPIYRPSLKRLHHRRSITIPGCDHGLIRKSHPCRGSKRRAPRRKQGPKFHATTSTDQETKEAISALQETTAPILLEGSGPITRKEDHYKIIVATIGAGMVGLAVLLSWFLLRKCCLKTDTSERKVLFLERINEDTDSLHSLALQWLVTELNKHENLTVKYSKWESLNLVNSPTKWLKNSVTDADVIILLLVPPTTNITASSGEIHIDQISTHGVWLTKTFFEMAKSCHKKKKFISVYFDNAIPAHPQLATDCDHVAFYQLMENIDMFYKTIGRDPKDASEVKKKFKLYNLVTRIRQSEKPTRAKVKQQHITSHHVPYPEKSLKYPKFGGARCKEFH